MLTVEFFAYNPCRRKDTHYSHFRQKEASSVSKGAPIVSK